jgi:hypothetical protein
MDVLRSLLEEMKQHGLERGHTLGLFHLLIGRRIDRQDGTVVCRGMTWRQLATLLKKARWDRKGVCDLGLELATLPPRDRRQFWYAAISKANVDSGAARQAGDALAALLKPLGYQIT